VVVSPEVAASLNRTCVKVLGHGEAVKHADMGRLDLTYTGAVVSGPIAFEEAGVTQADIKYASIYDSFTITGDRDDRGPGFLPRRARAASSCSTAAWSRRSASCRSTPDGGGLLQQPPLQPGRRHQGHRGGPPAARRGQRADAGAELRHRAGPRHGGSIGARMGSSTLILGQEDA